MAAMPTRSQLKKNLKALRARLEQRPMDLDARMRVARTYRLLDSRKESVAHYRHVARYLSLSGHPLQAIAVLKELLQVDPHHEETLLFLAKLYARTRAADTTNTGRVAVPILEEDPSAIALPEGLPSTGTGIWRAIRPQATETYSVVHAPEDYDISEDPPTDRNSSTHEILADEVVGEEILNPEDLGAVVVNPSYIGAVVDDDASDEGPGDISTEPTRSGEFESLSKDDGSDDVAMAAPLPIAEDAADEDTGVTADIAPPPHLRAEAAAGPNGPGAGMFETDVFDDDDPIEYSASDFLEDVNPEDLVLPQVPLFASLSPEAFVDLGHAMVFQRAKKGGVIFSEGDPGDSCIVIAAGTAAVTRANADGNTVTLVRLGEGDIAGLFALVLAENRFASLVAETYLEYFEIDRDAIDELVKQHPAVKVTLGKLLRDRLLLNLLAVLPVFGGMAIEERRTVVTQFKTKRYETGDALFAHGDEFDGLWVVLDGEVKVFKDSDATEAEMHLGPGEFAGSFAGTDDAECDRSAVATKPTVAALLPHREMAALIRKAEDDDDVRKAFVERKLMVSAHVYAGNGHTSKGMRSIKIDFMDPAAPQ